MVREEQADVLKKLNAIPEASREQLAEAEAELGSLQASSKVLSVKNEKNSERERAGNETPRSIRRPSDFRRTPSGPLRSTTEDRGT